MRHVLLWELEFDGSINRQRIASEPWITPAGDPDGCKQFRGDMMGDPEFAQRVSCAAWSDSPSTSIGAIEVSNADGRYDDWLTFDCTEARAVARLARPGQAWADTQVVWRGIVLRVEMVDRARLRVVLDTFHALLRRPLATVSVEDTDGNAGSAPVMIGQCYQVSPLLVDQPGLRYQLADCGINGLNTIMSGGSPYFPEQWDYDDEKIGFVSGISPFERVVANGYGSFGFGSNVLPTPDFDDFTGGVPTGWTVGGGTGTISEVPGVGVRIQWTVDTPPNLTTTSTTTLPDTAAGWYLVKGRLALLTAGGAMGVRFRGAGGMSITEAGDFARLIYVAAGADRTVTISAPLATENGELVLDYLEVRKISNTQSQFLGTALEQIVCVHGPLRYGQIDVDSVNAITSAASKQVGYFQPHGGAESIDAILWQLMAGWTGWWWIDELGQLRVGRLEAPDDEATPDLRLSPLDIAGGINVRTDLAPKLSDTYAGRRNWSPYSETELESVNVADPTPLTVEYRHVRTGAGSLHRTYGRARNAPPIRTLTSGGATQVSSEATRAVGMFARERKVYELRASLQSSAVALALQPGAHVRVTYPRFGLDAGRNLRLIGKRLRFRRGEVYLTLWG